MKQIKIQDLGDWHIAFFDTDTMDIYINKKYLNKKNKSIILTHEKSHLDDFLNNPRWLAYLKSFFRDIFDRDGASSKVYTTFPLKVRLKLLLYQTLTLGFVYFFAKMDNKWYFSTIFGKVKL